MALNNVEALNNFANILLETGNFEKGVALHQTILQTHPRFVDSYFNLGIAYYNVGDFPKSKDYLSVAAVLRPSAATYFYLGVAQIKTGQALLAEQSLLNATQRDPDRSDYHAALGIAYEVQGKLSQALEELGRARELNPRNPALPGEMEKIRRQMGEAR